MEQPLNNQTIKNDPPATEEPKPRLKTKSLKVLLLASMTLILVAIYIIAIKILELKSWWFVALILIDYGLLLLVNYLNKFKKKVWWLFGVLLALLPVLVLIGVGGFSWWLWLIVIGLYIATLVVYFLGLLSQSYWAVCLPLTLFLLLMLGIISR